MECRCGGLLFTSKFDSGNLARVEKVARDDDDEEAAAGGKYYSAGDLKPDYEFNVWTKPDCAGTEFENGNRSWFYFGVKGWWPGRLIKVNIVNMNKQGKLYSQGHVPLTRTLPGQPKWVRIRDRPTYENVDGQFILSFTYRLPEVKGATAYFVFCYPWSYTESQEQLEALDSKFEHCRNLTPNSSPDTLYYHRELICHTMDKLRVDLLTVTSCHGMLNENEPYFDKNLFPDRENESRCKMFRGKRVFLLSSRVHPGETPASCVFNGFLDFILRENDPRAKALRKHYVFKFIPMLNPDGVSRGHYRTDQRGVNLNRLYLDPSINLHPSIYASKSLLVFHHVMNRVLNDEDNVDLQIKFPGGFVLSSHDSINKCHKTANTCTPTVCSPMSTTSVKTDVSSPDPAVCHEEYTPRSSRTNVSNCNINNSNRVTTVHSSVTATGGKVLTPRAGVPSPYNQPPCSPRRTIITPHSDDVKHIPNAHPNTQTYISLRSIESIYSRDRDPNKPKKLPVTPRFSVRQPQIQKRLTTPKVEPLNLADLDDSEINFGLTQENESINVFSALSSVNINSGEKEERGSMDSELRLRLSQLTMSDDYKGRLSNGFTMSSQDTLESDDDNDTLKHETEHLGNEGSEDEGDSFIPSGISNNSPHLANEKLKDIQPKDSGIAFYVDLHGHASKRGCFMYGNCFENEDQQVENMLFPRLVSVNTAHFDFTGCNFSERNMYTKDKRDGMSKEGSGRVAVYKTLGIIHSYTLECNYNTGRMVNAVPPAFGDDGRATPPPLAGFPPKYTQAHFEEVGRAIAVSALDMIDCNPWTRLILSEHNSLPGIRENVRRYLRSLRGGARIPRNPTKPLSRTNSLNGPTNQNTNSKLSRFGNGNNTNDNSFSRQNYPRNNSITDSSSAAPPSRYRQQNTTTQNRKELGPVKEMARPNLSQSRRRPTQPGIRSAPGPTTSSDPGPVSLMMTTANERPDRQFSAGHASNSSRIMEEEKVEQLKHMNLLNISRKGGGTNSRIPLPTGRYLMNLSPTDLPPPKTPSTANLRPPKSGSPKKSATEHRHSMSDTTRNQVLSPVNQMRPHDQREGRELLDIHKAIAAPLPGQSSRHPHGPPSIDVPQNIPDTDAQRKRRRYTFMKRRSLVNQSPSSKNGNNSASGGRNLKQANASDASDVEKTTKSKRKRRKSSKKNIAAPSPSSDDTGQGHNFSEELYKTILHAANTSDGQTSRTHRQLSSIDNRRLPPSSRAPTGMVTNYEYYSRNLPTTPELSASRLGIFWVEF